MDARNMRAFKPYPLYSDADAQAGDDADRPDKADQEINRVIDAAVGAEAGGHLGFNVRAYDKAWTGEDEDTEFLVGSSGAKALESLREHSYDVVKRP